MCKLHPTNNARLLLSQPQEKTLERIDAIQGEDRQGRQSQALALCYLREDESAMWIADESAHSQTLLGHALVSVPYLE
jgi:hypothetical protein